MKTTETSPLQASADLRDEDAALEHAHGDAALAAELMDTLIAGLPEELESLRACLAEADWHGLAEYASQVRGASRYCGVPALDGALAALERAAIVEDPMRCTQCFDDVEAQIERLRAHYATSAAR